MKPPLRSSGLGVIVALAFVAAAAPVRADDARAAKQEARQHFDAGKRLIKKKQFAEAVAELEQAYQLDPRAEHLYNIAVAHHLSGNHAEAAEHYRRFLAENPSGKTARDAARFLAQLEQDAAKRAAEDLARRDAEAADAATRAAAQAELDAEARRLAALTARAEQAERRAAELERELSVVAVEIDSARIDEATQQARRDAAQALARRWERDARGAPSAGGRGRRVAGAMILAGGVGVLTHTGLELLDDDVERRSGSAAIMVPAGAAAVVIGLGLYVWGETAVRSPRSRSVVERARVVPAVGPSAVALSLSAEF